MEKTMKKSYKISRVIIVVITIIALQLFFINESGGFKIIPFIFAAILFGLSYPSSVISRKLINIGNKIQSIVLRTLYYEIFLLLISLFIFVCLCIIIGAFYNNVSASNDLATGLSYAIGTLFLLILAFTTSILPYIQTLIVLVLNHFIKEQ